MILVYHLFFDGSKKLLEIPDPDIEKELKERSYDDSEWSYILDFDPTIIEDIRYATVNNFVEEQLYDCGKCFLRPMVAEALINANTKARTIIRFSPHFSTSRPAGIDMMP